MVAFLRYNLYNIFMKDTRLTFFDPTNITLPIVIFNTLVNDAFHFGFVKNKQANISGLLNCLLPCLADYRDDLHKNLLSANNNDEDLTNKIEESIYKIYFNKYDYCDDGTVNVPFRVNKEHLQDFLEIFDNKLSKYNMDFTGYVRSLLIEYASKRLNQREYFFFYRKINDIKTACTENSLCYFYTSIEKDCFIPVSIEVSRNTETTLIVGINQTKDTAYVLPLASLQRIVVTDTKVSITENDCNFIYETLENYYEETETD